jgi:DegV family protein with EDD domain
MTEILTDSCSDLSPELSEKFRVHTLPLLVYINQRSYHDGLDITLAELYQSVQKTGELPKTSAPSVADFIEFFNRYPDELLFIGIGSRLSATLQSAKLAAEQIKDRPIRLIDSANLSTGIGLLVLRAAELRDQGMNSAEIEKEIRALIPKVRNSFVVDTLDYLYKGGRAAQPLKIL